jgi:hypothetical protein
MSFPVGSVELRDKTIEHHAGFRFEISHLEPRAKSYSFQEKTRMIRGSFFFSHEKIEINEIGEAHESQTEEHDWIVCQINDDSHNHWSQAYS